MTTVPAAWGAQGASQTDRPNTVLSDRRSLLALVDRWARRSPATVVAAAVKHGAAHHEQQHRARHDMGVGDAHR